MNGEARNKPEVEIACRVIRPLRSDFFFQPYFLYVLALFWLACDVTEL